MLSDVERVLTKVEVARNDGAARLLDAIKRTLKPLIICILKSDAFYLDIPVEEHTARILCEGLYCRLTLERW
jgi:hypothetical protein